MLPSGGRWSKTTVSSRTDTLKSFAGPSAAQEAGSFITGNHKEKKRFKKKKNKKNPTKQTPVWLRREANNFVEVL